MVFIADVARFLELLGNNLLIINLFKRIEHGYECMTGWSVFMLVFVSDGGAGAGLNRIYWSWRSPTHKDENTQASG